MLWPVALLACIAAAQGRAVNISNTWVLPEEGFPVFYRYFRDRISWYEADAVCQFHHANLVTVDTTAQYDAVRAYLKELDISSAVWVGLIRSNPDGEFTWTDYRGLGGDGYWSSAPDARAAPLCAAADPAADYRWEARACGGPTVASFICELPVPQWALGNQGCMVKALPALTVLYLPESAAVQLTADCGLAGTKQVQCTGNVKREDLLRNLSCAEDEESSISTLTSFTVSSSATSDSSFGEQDSSTDTTTEELNITTEHMASHGESILRSTLAPPAIKPDIKPEQKQDVVNKFRGMYTQKTINIDLLQSNNLQSNDIPKLAKNENMLTLEESEKLEDEKNMQHKLLHDELARHGNFETIFTQPTDHFVPPLVMAKAKISDDMTVLSLAQKHAQQLAEQKLASHKLPEFKIHTVVSRTTEDPSNVEIIEKPLVMTMQPSKSKYTGKKDKTKLGLPKKYNEKYTDPKSKNVKNIETKVLKSEKSLENPKLISPVNMGLKTTSKPITVETEDETSIDLTVMLKELGVENSRVSRYSNLSNSVPKETNIQLNVTVANETSSAMSSTENAFTNNSTEPEIKIPVTMNHEVIKITIIDENNKSNTTPKIFEITTRMPEFIEETTKTTAGTELSTLKQTTTEAYNYNITEPLTDATTIKTYSVKDTIKEHNTTNKETSEPSTSEVSSTAKSITNSFDKFTVSETTTESVTDSIEISTKTSVTNVHLVTNNENTEDHTVKPATTATISVTNSSETSEMVTEQHEIDVSDTATEIHNVTVHHEDDLKSVTNAASEITEDFHSPLLSGASEPLHRPNRLRRPQPPPSHMNKFNPFRILG